MALLNKEISNEAESELGPLKYLAQITGRDMNTVVNWFLLLIIFVFDPLAISMVVAANFAFAQIKRKEPDVVMSVPDGMEFNKPYPMPKSWLDPKDEGYDASEGLEEMLEKENLKNQDMPEEVLEEENLLDLQQDVNEGKALAKGLDTFIEVLEGEERDSESLEESKSSEHELYHGSEEKRVREDVLSKTNPRRVIKRKRKVKANKPQNQLQHVVLHNHAFPLQVFFLKIAHNLFGTFLHNFLPTLFVF